MNKDQYFVVITFLAIISLSVSVNSNGSWIDNLIVLVFSILAWIDALIKSFKKD